MTPEPAKFISRSEAERPPDPPVEQPADGSALLVPVPVDMRNAALTLLAVIACVLMLQYAQTVFIALVLGLLISYALDPAVTRLEKIRVPRAAGAAILILALVGGGAVLPRGRAHVRLLRSGAALPRAAAAVAVRLLHLPR